MENIYMRNIVFDINIILDIYSEKRDSKFPESRKVYELAKKAEDLNIYISSSSLDNIEFLKYQQLCEDNQQLTRKQRQKIARLVVKELLKDFRVAKTPSYIDIDYDDIEDSQVISSAIAIDAQVITRDEGMQKKYPDIAISPDQFFLDYKNNIEATIDFANLKKQYFDLQPEIEKQMDEVLNTTSFIMGDKVRELEEKLQEFTSAKHAITCSSGTDALLLAMMAMDILPGDEIITTPFTFIATAETISLMKATPVFVDIEADTFNIDATKIEAAITDKTKAIMPVSLYGQPADMDKIQAVADKYGLKVIIDGAQSFGATYKGKMDSNLGDISTTSFFPAKPLGCYGDGGAVFTNNDDYAKRMKMMRVHGQNKRYHHKYIGMGGRLDTIQAAILLAKLPSYQQELMARQQIAQSYNHELGETIKAPLIKSDRTSAWAQYTVRINHRDDVQKQLSAKNIPIAVHYPMPLHLQKCFQYLNYKQGGFPVAERASKEVMSLPMNPFLSNDEIKHISQNLKHSSH